MTRWMYVCISSVTIIDIGLKSLFLSIKARQIVNLKIFILNSYITNQNPHSKLTKNLLLFLSRPLYAEKVFRVQLASKFQPLTDFILRQTHNFVSKGLHELSQYYRWLRPPVLSGNQFGKRICTISIETFIKTLSHKTQRLKAALAWSYLLRSWP